MSNKVKEVVRIVTLLALFFSCLSASVYFMPSETLAGRIASLSFLLASCVWVFLLGLVAEDIEWKSFLSEDENE